MDSSLEVIEVTRVTPSDSFETVTLPLTFFDLLWFKIHPVERVIFYTLAEVTRPFFDSVIVPKLKSSLSLSLSHYLPLAGKLVWDSSDQKPTIVYAPNDAVLFTVAETNADFSCLSGDEPFSSTELHPLVPELRVSEESASAMSLVTLFPTQGFCIGITAHHGVSDGKTTSMFLKSWAHLCKQANHSLPEDLIPSYDRTVINSPSEIETFIISAFNSFTKTFAGGKEPANLKSLKLFPSPEIDHDVVRFTFKLTREDIQTLRERLKRESSDSKQQLRLSTFVITFSYAFACLIRARGGDPDRFVGYRFAVDYKSLAVAPLNYFGNCVSAAVRIPLTAAKFLGEEGFLAAVRFVSDSVEKLDENVAWKKIPEHFKMYSSTPVESQVLSVAGSTRFGVYGLDFGWGIPERVVIVSIDQGTISLAESRDGSEGVEIGFSLKKQEMDVLIRLLQDKLEN
ncbi:hypothetical protein Bca4012_083067 [Brassica carinata]|uniref:Phenolic glucoside malonyltransferase 1-like n=1 Tax=Brassica carinata TaxID=52824 RepID=A0A8X7VB05_BRACI|nr:hypothetical protein Bca52824_027729 [Brassica carinata]